MTSIILDDGGHTRECDRVVTISRASLTTWNDPRIEPLLNRSVVRRGKPSPSPGCAGGPTRTRSRIPSRSWRGPTLSRGSGTGSGLRPWLPRGPRRSADSRSPAHVRCTPHRPRGAPKGHSDSSGSLHHPGHHGSLRRPVPRRDGPAGRGSGHGFIEWQRTTRNAEHADPRSFTCTVSR